MHFLVTIAKKLIDAVELSISKNDYILNEIPRVVCRKENWTDKVSTIALFCKGCKIGRKRKKRPRSIVYET